MGGQHPPRGATTTPPPTPSRCDSIDEAVTLLTSGGLSFAATGTDWAALPDGSYISDYATGERREVTAHLDGFTHAAVAAIVPAVG